MDEGPEHALRQLLHDPPQDLSRPGRVFFLEDIDHEDGIGHVRPYGRHLLLAQDVDPGHLDEAAAPGQAGQARVDETLAGQAVQDDVDARPVRRVEDLLPEGRRAAVEDMLDAQRPEVGPLARARGREHLRAGGLGELDRRQPHAACSGVNQDPLAGCQARHVEGERRRHERGRHGRQFRDGEPRRRRHDQVFGDHGLGSERAERHAHDAVARRDARDAGARFEHPPAELSAQGILDQADRDEHVPEVQPDGLDRDANLLRFKRDRRQGLNLNRVERAPRVGRERPGRVVRRRKTHHALAGPDQPGGLTAAEPVGDVVLRIRIQQFVDEISQRRPVTWVEVDHPRLQMRSLPHHHLAQTPERGARQFAAGLLLQHLRPTGYEPHAVGRRRADIADALRQRQGARRRAPCVAGHFQG